MGVTIQHAEIRGAFGCFRAGLNARMTSVQRFAAFGLDLQASMSTAVRPRSGEGLRNLAPVPTG